MPTKPTVLVLAEPAITAQWAAWLQRVECEVTSCSSQEDALPAFTGTAVVILRLADAGQDLPALIGRLRRAGRTRVILVQARESPDLAAAARHCGVSDYLREPLPAGELIAAVEACLAETPESASELGGGERMVGSGRRMADVRQQIALIAATDCNVLITGETGTGKELAAELIHRNSRRKERPFVCINCAAIPEALLESELFGYEKGSFTGAHTARPGQLELAHGGVLFLDEIGEMSLHAQAKILRAIEGKEVQRLGRRTGIRVDVRIVCATNRDLEADVKRGLFRADLYFRLKVAQLHLPPLRERKEDLRELAQFYFRQLNERMGRHVSDFTECSWRTLLHHDWPGNVREFKNVIEASMVQIPYARMKTIELSEEFHRRYAPAVEQASEEEQLLAALVSHNWNKSKAAQQLNWSRMTVYRKMVKYQLSPVQRGRAAV